MDGQDMWRLQVLGETESHNWSDEAAREIISKAIGDQVEYELVSVIPWARRELVREHFALGRCFLVGDSAHQLSPTGGYGMNTGISEAMDLSWKLAATIEGWGGSDLLASYHAERKPVALRNVAQATTNFRRMVSVQGHPDMMQPGARADRVRSEIGDAIRQVMANEWESMGIHLGYVYENSPIVVSDGSVAPENDPVSYIPSSRPGARAPHVWLAPGHSTLDLFGRGFALLCFDEGADPYLIAQAARQRSVPLEIVHIRNAEASRIYEKSMVLVRPDGHVAWRGNSAEGQSEFIIETVRGAGSDCLDLASRQSEDGRTIAESNT